MVFPILLTKGGETKTKRLLSVGRPNQAHMMFQQQPSEIINSFQFMLLTFSHPCRHEASDESIRIHQMVQFALVQLFYTDIFYDGLWKLVWEKRFWKAKQTLTPRIPCVASPWDPGVLYAMGTRNMKHSLLSVLSSLPVLLFKGTLGIHKTTFCYYLRLIISELQKIIHL